MSRALHVHQDDDGMVVIRGRLTPEAGAALMQALAAARETLYQRAREVFAETSMEQQQADALALLAETALHHGIDPGTPGERYQVVVHVDAEVLADADAPGQSVLDGGTHVSAETSRRLACDATRVVGDRRVASSGPAALGVGRARAPSYGDACAKGLPGRRTSPTAMATFSRFHAMPLRNAAW